MSALTHAGKPLAIPLRVLAVVVAAGLLLATALANVASAHGSTINPPSRNYGCWKRWGGNFQAPEMATQDPMCWQAWQADPNGMWNWNGLYRDGVAGNHQAAVPDGQLCSAGRADGNRYAALDKPGAWQAAQVSNNFSVTVHDQALHGADYFRFYVTRQGFNPLTDQLRWSNLELLKETGRYAPGAGTPVPGDPVLNGVSNTVSLSAPGRTGRHIVYTIWKASHSDQTYYWCSDVVFGGGGTPPPTTTPPATTPPPTTAPPTTVPATTPPPDNGSGHHPATDHRARGYEELHGQLLDHRPVVGRFPGGCPGRPPALRRSPVGRSNGPTPTANRLPRSGALTSPPVDQPSPLATSSYNGALGAGGSTNFGLLGSYSTSNGVPTVTCTAT